MIGWGLFQLLPEAMGTCSPATRRPRGSGLQVLDMLDTTALAQALEQWEPDIVLHCAAICKVEKCEQHPDYAWSVNVGGTKNLLEVLPAGTRLVYCSSDHVFSGDRGPYSEETTPDPLSHYGVTRVEAERLVLERTNSLVIRVPLCVGPSYNGRSGHLDWLRHRHQKGLPMTIVLDEHRSALPLQAAAERVLQMATSNLTGLRHLTATRVVSRPDLARHLSVRQRLPINLEFQSRAERSTPHLGRVEMATRHNDRFAQPIPSVLEDDAELLAQARL
jgi:dTDP-4-dehydrorhamnose reductase